MNNLLNQVLGLLNQNKPVDALRALTPLLASHPDHLDCLFLAGICHSMSGNKPQSIAAYDHLLKLNPRHPGALLNRGADLFSLRQYEMARLSLELALEIEPSNPMVLLNLGYVENACHQPSTALNFLHRALTENPHYPEAWCAKADALGQLGKINEAISAYKQAISLDPAYADAPNNLGLLLVQEHRPQEAVEVIRQALSKCPHLAILYNTLGIAYTCCNDPKLLREAHIAYIQAIRLDPAMGDAYRNLAELLVTQRQYVDASKFYDAALDHSNDRLSILGPLIHNRMKICDWSDYKALTTELLAGVDHHQGVVSPFNILGIPSNPQQQLRTAVDFCREAFAKHETVITEDLRRGIKNRKIRIGYLSNDFQSHATAYLMAELFELHNRHKFEIFAYSYSAAPNDVMRERITRGCDHFADISQLSDQEASHLIALDKIDILVDLKGHTEGARLGILSHRPAPIQAHYLGYPGTTGASFIDYLIADSTLIQPADEAYYTEKIVRLPNTYQVNDRNRAMSRTDDGRSAHGLPSNQFVFCCFNNNWKITPEIFNVWMRLLQQCQQSVLWLIEDNKQAVKNLRQAATSQGIISERLIFAEKIPVEQHLTRHRHADLFLDTPHYNAHTTASDALWSGLPVLTLKGDTFAGRVAESLLRAADLPEMVADTLDHYAHMAEDFYDNPYKLDVIRAKLDKTRMSIPLFDAPRFTRNIEHAYDVMLQRLNTGLEPAHLTIST